MKLTPYQVTALKNLVENYYKNEFSDYKKEMNNPVSHIFDDLFILSEALKEQTPCN